MITKIIILLSLQLYQFVRINMQAYAAHPPSYQYLQACISLKQKINQNKKAKRLIIYLYPSIPASQMRKRDQTTQPAQEDALLLKEIKYRSFAKILLMVLNLCLSPFYFGYTIQYLGTFNFDNIIELFGISISPQAAKGLYNGCVPIGAGVGALSSFLLLKKFSRKNSLLVVNGIALLFGLLLMVPNQITFFIARIMQGVCVGLYSAIAPLIIKEFAPVEIAGTLGAFNQLFVAGGVFFACLLQYIMKKVNDNLDQKEKDYWFIIFGFTLITTLVQTVLLLVVYRFETPRYLLENGREAQAKEVVEWIYLDQYVEEIMTEKKIDLGLMPPTGQDKVSVMSADTLQQGKKQTKQNKLRLGVSIHLAMLQQFVGINAVVIYGTQIAASVFPDQKNLVPVILNLEQTLTCLVTSYLLTRLGRKTILQGGTLVAVISLLLIGIGFFIRDSAESAGNVMVIGGLVIFMADFGLSLGPVVWLYIPEILQPNLIAFSTLANWTVASLITIFFPILKNIFGTPAYLFLFYAIYSTVGLIFSQKFVIETKGKPEKEIYEQYEQLAA